MSSVQNVLGAKPGVLYAMGPHDRSNKGGDHEGAIVYPKSAQLGNGRIIVTFERSIGDPGGQTQWVFGSDDLGKTWSKIAEIQPPSIAAQGTPLEVECSKYVSNWTDPYLYVLPETIGSLKAGTVLLATVVSGDDEYYREKKTAEGDAWFNPVDGDRRNIAIALYKGSADGTDWSLISIIDAGGWQGGSARSRPGQVCSQANLDENGYAQADPIWEPYLIAIDGKLVCYYSDERDTAENEAQHEETGGQILVHRVSGDGVHWGKVVPDVGYAFENWRPGMMNVVPTTDGKWLCTYEWIIGPVPPEVHYKVSDTPFDLREDDAGNSIKELGDLAEGGSPVLLRRSDGSIVYNACGSGAIWINHSGRSDGSWEKYDTPMKGGFSRNLMEIQGNGNLLLLESSFDGVAVHFGDYSLGR